MCGLTENKELNDIRWCQQVDVTWVKLTCWQSPDSNFVMNLLNYLVSHFLLCHLHLRLLFIDLVLQSAVGMDFKSVITHWRTWLTSTVARKHHHRESRYCACHVTAVLYSRVCLLYYTDCHETHGLSSDLPFNLSIFLSPPCLMELFPLALGAGGLRCWLLLFYWAHGAFLQKVPDIYIKHSISPVVSHVPAFHFYPVTGIIFRWLRRWCCP